MGLQMQCWSFVEYHNLLLAFFYLFPIALFDYIARMSHKYAFKDWVETVDVIDRDHKVAPKKSYYHVSGIILIRDIELQKVWLTSLLDILYAGLVS